MGILILLSRELSGKTRLECPSGEDQGTVTFRLPGQPFSPRYLRLTFNPSVVVHSICRDQKAKFLFKMGVNTKTPIDW